MSLEDTPNIGALIIRIGFGVYSTIIITRSPQDPILIIKAPVVPSIGAFDALSQSSFHNNPVEITLNPKPKNPKQ